MPLASFPLSLSLSLFGRKLHVQLVTLIVPANIQPGAGRSKSSTKWLLRYLLSVAVVVVCRGQFEKALRNVAGMSTVHEAITARQCGINVFAFSLITNACIVTDHTDLEADIQEVIDTADMRATPLKQLVAAMVEAMATSIEDEDNEDNSDSAGTDVSA